MAKKDYTKYLGKEVEFFTPFNVLGCRLEIDVFERVKGIVSGVVLFQDLSQSEFFLGGNTYLFSEVVFLNDD